MQQYTREQVELAIKTKKVPYILDSGFILKIQLKYKVGDKVVRIQTRNMVGMVATVTDYNPNNPYDLYTTLGPSFNGLECYIPEEWIIPKANTKPDWL